MPRVTKAELHNHIDYLNVIRKITGRIDIKLMKNKFDEFSLKVGDRTIGFDKKHPAEMLEQIMDITRWEGVQPKTGNIQVNNWREFALFNYTQYTRPGYQLGEVVLIFPPSPSESDDYSVEEDPKIGVIIQTHEYGDFRTDMNGNGCNDEVRYADVSDIEKYRPELLEDLLN